MVILISASPEFYIKEFYAIDEVDLIIGTRFKFENGKFIRSMDGNNCKGQEKVRRLKDVLKEKNIRADFKNSYMFSDSLSDKPLLDLVGNPYLINYKKQHFFRGLSTALKYFTTKPRTCQYPILIYFNSPKQCFDFRRFSSICFDLLVFDFIFLQFVWISEVQKCVKNSICKRFFNKVF